MYEIINNDNYVCYGDSRQGGRTENQDSMGFNAEVPGGRLILTVCDGMGGAAGGQTASTIAATEIVAYLSQWTGGAESPTDALRAAINAANIAVYNKAMECPELRGMGTTTTVLMIGKEAAYAAYVGDSRIYQLRHGKKVFRTFDHSRVFELVKAGGMTEEQARVHPNANLITRALGIGQNVEIDTFTLPYNAGDRFVLCCDGVWNSMPEPELIEMLSSEQTLGTLTHDVMTKVEAIGEAKGGDYDNLTAILLDVKHSSDMKECWVNKIYKNAIAYFKQIF